MLTLLSQSLHSQANRPDAVRFENLRTDRFHWENDFGITDRHYTNGLRRSRVWSSTEFWQRKIGTPLLNLLLLGARACGTNEEGCYTLRTGWAIGQNFYTPQIITDEEANPQDRPYAGFLYYGQLFELIQDRWVHEIEFDVGVLGPLALAGPVQAVWHQLWGWDHPEGWDHQIAHGLGIQAIYRSSYGLVSARVDGQKVSPKRPAHISVTPSGQVSVGTPVTRAYVGGMLRLGRGIPPNMVPRIPAPAPPPAPPVAVESEALAASAEDDPADMSMLREDAARARALAERPRHAPVRPFYFFGGGSIHGVLLNDFLQGTHLGAVSENPRIDIEMNRTFSEAEAGLTFFVPLTPVDVTFRRVWRSAEFRGAPDHVFWALSVAW
ncbi:MAG TPA: lipid A deacylase LpxR family protein [Longimicrobium sp.]|nr:lipid A deacylase LpxR family protein [Longimicrobium sp.]